MLYNQPQAQHPDAPVWSQVDLARVDDRELEVLLQTAGMDMGIAVLVPRSQVPEKYQYRTRGNELVEIAWMSAGEYRAYHDGLAVVPMYAHWPLVLERLGNAVEAL